MLSLLGLAAAVAEQPDLSKVAIEYGVVPPSQMRVPVSASVRAATWDMLTIKPAEPVPVRLACLVWNHGAIGGCLPAALVPTGATTIDWQKLRQTNQQAIAAMAAGDRQTQGVAELRLGAALMPRGAGKNPLNFTVRFFDETVSPADARPPFTPRESLRMADVTLKTPLDPSLLQALFPVPAMRYGVDAQVSVQCRIEPALTLLCRDPGHLRENPANWGNERDSIMQSLQFATYQLASTMTLNRKSKTGRDVVGSDLTLVAQWQVPR